MGLQGDSEMSLTYPKDPEGQPGHIAIRGFAKLEMNSKADSPRPSSQASRQFKALLIVIAIYGLFKTAVYGLVDWDSNYFLVPGRLEFSFLQAVKQGQPYVDWDFTRENIEEVFLSVPNPKSALASSRSYTTYPHLAGSTADHEDALSILKLFQTELNIPASDRVPQFDAGSPESRNATLNIGELKGLNAWIDVYYPVMNTGLERKLQIFEEGVLVWDGDLVEDGDPLDPEAAKYRDAIPTWHGLSKDGDVKGQLIYANYGTQEDYQNLLSIGTNFTEKIVLVRYGAIFRGLKIKGAQELGAVGVLIYSDPRDDGSVTVENGYEPYPAGPASNPTSVQRGSVQFISMYPGDPTTPGYPSYKNSTRTEGENIPQIPSLPISWYNAQRLLQEIDEPGKARMLTGKASEKVVRLLNKVDTKVMPIWNTMAVIPGHIKSETVVIGTHRDAWVMGAADPTSGVVSQIEVVKGLGVLLKNGWRPLRNIVIASWDAEEYGLIGSTEWGEDFADWISTNVVTYLNLDVSVAGSRWVAAASPSLAHLIGKTARDISHPTDPQRTLWDAAEDAGPYKGPVDDEFKALYESTLDHQKAAQTGVFPLGSGSDFTVFLQRLGIASMDQSFSFTPTDAVYHYHSIYDSQRWQEVFGDPTFGRHVAVAKHLGLMSLRIADAIILPLNTTQYSLELDTYLDDIDSISPSPFSKLRSSIRQLQKASKALDSEKAQAEKRFKELFKRLPRKNLSYTQAVYQRITQCLKREFWFGEESPVEEFVKVAKRVQKANSKLVAFEKGFISEDGIKDREWYRHLGVAPGKWLGYGATTFPALTEALKIERNSTLAEYEAKRLTDLIDKLTNVLNA